MSNISVNKLRLRTFIASLCFFFLLGSYYVLKPTRKPLLFKYVGKDYLHHFYNASVFVTLFAVVIYNRLVNRFSRTQLLRTVYFAIIGAFLGFAVLIQSLGNDPAYDALMASVYFFFVSLYILFVTALFWSISHDIHKNQEAKKFYPYIFLGGQLGVIAGSKFTSTFIESSSYETMLVVAALGLGITWALIETFYLRLSKDSLGNTAKPNPTGALEDFKLFFQNRYVFFIGLIMVLATFTSTVSDQQFSWLVDNSILKDKAFYELQNHDMLDSKSFINSLRERNDDTSRELYSYFSPRVQQQINDGKNEFLLSEIILELRQILKEKSFSTKPKSKILLQMSQETIATPGTFLGRFFFNEEQQKQAYTFMQNKMLLGEVYPRNFQVITPQMIRNKNLLILLRDRNSPLTNYLYSLLREETKSLLDSYSEDNLKHDEEENQTVFSKALIEFCYDVNTLIQQPSFYQQDVFALTPLNDEERKRIVVFAEEIQKINLFHSIKLSTRVSNELKKENISAQKWIIINKLVLEESFPQIVDMQSKLQGKIWAENNYYMGFCNIAMCLVITPLLIYLFGPALSVCLYPLVLFVGAIFFIQELSVYTVRYFAIVALTLNYTLYKVGVEIFYVPTDKNVKYKAKAVCDTFLFRLGDASSALMVTVYLFFVTITGAEYSLTNLSYVVFGITFIWIVSILKTGKLYKEHSQQ